MDESRDVSISTLIESGVMIPGDSSCIDEFSPEAFDMHLQKVEAVLKDLTMTSPISSTVVDSSLSLKTDEQSDVPKKEYDLLLEELESGSLELSSLESELDLLGMVADKLLDDKLPVELYLEQLNQQLVAKKSNIKDLIKQWGDVRLTLDAKKIRLLDQLHVEEPEAKEKLQKLRKTQLEIHSLSSEIQMREDERCDLYIKLERQPKAAPRKSHIHGIKEITKNSRKLDTDIQRISGETRELQLESNLIQERLHRSYALVDEMVTREVKKDPAVRQVYKLVTNIHGIFEQISEKILMTDRLRRETVDYDKKLGSITARGMSLEKLQADLDAMRKENESLEKSQN